MWQYIIAMLAVILGLASSLYLILWLGRWVTVGNIRTGVQVVSNWAFGIVGSRGQGIGATGVARRQMRGRIIRPVMDPAKWK